MTETSILALPAGALRRSWILKNANDLQYGLRWLAMLREVAPASARGLSPLQPLKCYQALMAHCRTLFPVFEPWFEDDWDDEMHMTRAEMTWEHGLPVDYMGLSYEDYSFEDSISLANAVCMCFPGPHDSIEREAGDFKMLKPYQRILKPFVDVARLEDTRPYRFPGPGRARRWCKPWDAARDLYLFSHSATEYLILNVSHFDIAEVGYEYPPWHIGEIKGWTREWQRARPVWERIQALDKYITARPDERLGLLAGILAGDKIAIRDLTEPEPGRGKTLAEILK